MALTYYRPNVSGLTVHVERLATALVARGHEVTVLASRHDRRLPDREVVDGVTVTRAPVVARISRGVLLPTFGSTAARLAERHDVVHVHLPQFDAWRAVRAARRRSRPVVVTQHCELDLGGPRRARAAGAVTVRLDRWTAERADRIITYTDDYAASSRVVAGLGAVAVRPPVPQHPTSVGDGRAFRQRHGLGDGPLVGLVGRFASEKGIEVLAAAVADLPEVTVVFAGPVDSVAGEAWFRRRLGSALDRLGARWREVGVLGPAELPACYQALDALVVASTNRTEAYGLVQVEAMSAGTPVIATDLPGVRDPVRRTGFGGIVPPGDAAALREAISATVRCPPVATGMDRFLAEHDPGFVAARHEAIYQELLHGSGAR